MGITSFSLIMRFRLFQTLTNIRQALIQHSPPG